LYSEALDWLFSQFPSYQNIGASAYKPDLGNIRLLCAFFDNPQNDIKFIHVAGTNGKGSVSSMLASILIESGEKTGLFTSPHIHDFRERIRINGEMISEEEVISFCNHLRTSALDFEPSFFEITCCMALVHFKRNNCTIAVIETGLGGRLDATNIVTPILSIITNISLEHTQFLGNDLASIAGEKAGIIKQQIPVVIGRSTIATHDVFQSKANEKGAEIVFCDNHPLPDASSLPLLGHYQQENARTVYAAVHVLKKHGFQLTDAHILQGLKNLKVNTGIFGRMEVIQRNPLIILDVSHNEEGIRSTLDYIQSQTKGELYLIYGSSSDKDIQSILPLFPSITHLSFCAFSNARSLTIQQLKEIASSKNPESKCFMNIFEALEEIKTLANTEDTILVFGSFFLISDYYGTQKD
jgi:dihydrofolate synthase/folylpolyglutamate synthase